MSDILAKICADTRAEVERRKQKRPLTAIRYQLDNPEPPRGFHKALAARAERDGWALICEIKKASPSKGLIRPDFDPIQIARDYEAGGATCLSVLTDIPYFQGSDAYLVAARMMTALPCLRKDFMLDPYQIWESRGFGADCILLILAALEDTQAAELEGLALELGMDVLLEVHDEAELERALKLTSPLIGVNNRNLKTLEVTLDTTRRLAKLIPTERFLVAESGIYSRDDVQELAGLGAKAFLIGESLMRQDDVRAAARALAA